ncbi:MAG TPA: GAF domain-containing protein [Actinobacteria bacterium]|nr:GAF domain-containing protein [Actinomycetota bacterium]
MQTIDQIEKRRREIRYINYFLIYLLAMSIFGIFFFIDVINGFFGALEYNIMLRLYFISFVAAVILYLAQKEKQQRVLARKLLTDMEKTSQDLAKEVRNKEFLSTISFLISNLRDNTVLEKLFNVTRQFFQADGGAVILRNEHRKWSDPLVTFPENVDPVLIDDITKLISKTGRSFIQPEPGTESHQPIKGAKNLIAVPLRLEGRLWGVITVWFDSTVTLGKSELEVLEIIACEASNSALTIEISRERNELLHGLLELISKAVDAQGGAKNRSMRIAEQAKALAQEMDLPKATVEAVEMAARLKNVHHIVGNGKKNGNASGASAKILKSLNFPSRVTQILAANGNSKRSVSVGSSVVTLAEAYVNLAYPSRGRARATSSIIAKLETDSHDEQVLEALKQLIIKPKTDSSIPIPLRG